MKAMLAKLLDRPKFFNDRKVVTCRDTVFFDNYSPLTNSGQQTLSWSVVKYLNNYYQGNQLTEQLAKDYLDSIGDNSFYALKYTVAEILCLVTCILQIILTDEVTTSSKVIFQFMFSFLPLFQFLNNNFLKYGSSVMSHLSEDPYNRTDPMATTLPIVTMCTMSESFGTGGRGRTIDVRTVFLAASMQFLLS